MALIEDHLEAVDLPKEKGKIKSFGISIKPDPKMCEDIRRVAINAVKTDKKGVGYAETRQAKS